MKLYQGFVLLAVCLNLTGCNQTREVLGLNRNTNDEFDISTTAPLTLPPSYNQLPEPKAPNSKTEFLQESTSQAKQLALEQFSSKSAGTKNSKTASEEVLLAQVRAENKDSNIRSKIDEESKTEYQKNQSFVKDMLLIKSDEVGKVIDPYEEKKRLEKEEQ